jgi:kinesin family protein 5
MASNIRVCCRFRPFNKLEKKNNSTSCVEHDLESVAVTDNDKKVHDFSFDRIFGDTSSQAEVFEFTAKPVINEVFEGMQ